MHIEKFDSVAFLLVQFSYFSITILLGSVAFCIGSAVFNQDFDTEKRTQIDLVPVMPSSPILMQNNSEILHLHCPLQF